MLTKINDKYVLRIPHVLDAESLDEFFNHLDNLEFQNIKEIFIDCSAVEKVSIRYLAILCQAHSKMRGAGIEVHLESIPDNLRAALNKHNTLILMGPVPAVAQSSRQVAQCTDSKSQRTIEMSFRPDADDIVRVLDIYEAFLINNSIFEIEVFELITVFYEVATNIRLHANLEERDRIVFSSSICEGDILMKFEDPGIAFDPEMKLSKFDPVEALKTGKMRGMGIILIKRLIDSLSYTRSDDGRNILFLKKNIGKRGR